MAPDRYPSEAMIPRLLQAVGITAGEPVLLVDFPGRDLIVVHLSHTIAAALAGLHARILGEPR